MDYSNGHRRLGPSESFERLKARARIRKAQRKSAKVSLDDLMDAFKGLKSDGELSCLPESQAREALVKTMQMIRAGKYSPKATTKKLIQKPNGGIRQLDIPPAMDRVVAKAVLQQISPVIDKQFDPRSHGGRPNLGPPFTLATAAKAIAAGKTFVVAADIKDAFPSLPTESALACLGKLLGSTNANLELAKVSVRGHLGHKRVLGIGQGSPLSPLVFNCFMHEWVDSTTFVAEENVALGATVGARGKSPTAGWTLLNITFSSHLAHSNPPFPPNTESFMIIKVPFRLQRCFLTVAEDSNLRRSLKQ